MIDPARTKRAARLRWERMNPGISWDNVRADAKAEMEASIARTAADLFPELDGDEPKAWLAPRHMTDAMIEAVEAKVSHMDTASDELVNFDFAQADRFWRAARGAYVREQT